MKTYTGIEIGSSQVKFAVVSDGSIRKLAKKAIPENLVRDGAVVSPEAMIEVLREAVKKYKIGPKNCALVLPGSLVYTRQVTMPYMTIEQLNLNLPYEFRDYISEDKEKYFYDYVVVSTEQDESGKTTGLNLLAAAVLKSTIRDYSDMLRRAGFRMKIVLTEEFAYRNLLMYGNCDDDVVRCFIDFGHTATKLYIFHGIDFEASRVIDYGGEAVDQAIADAMNVDQHAAEVYKTSNYENAQNLEACQNVYSRIATEVKRAVNFYSFNSGGKSIEEIYFCGGGEKLTPLTDAISDALELEIGHISDLIAEGSGNLLPVCATAVGATLQ